MMMYYIEVASSDDGGIKRKMISECNLVISRKSEVAKDSKI